MVYVSKVLSRRPRKKEETLGTERDPVEIGSPGVVPDRQRICLNYIYCTDRMDQGPFGILREKLETEDLADLPSQ